MHVLYTLIVFFLNLIVSEITRLKANSPPCMSYMFTSFSCLFCTVFVKNSLVNRSVRDNCARRISTTFYALQIDSSLLFFSEIRSSSTNLQRSHRVCTPQHFSILIVAETNSLQIPLYQFSDLSKIFCRSLVRIRWTQGSQSLVVVICRIKVSRITFRLYL